MKLRLKRFYFLFCFLSLLLALPEAGWAQSTIDGILIQADSTEGFTEKDQFLLKGNVQVAFEGQTLKCDEALIDTKREFIEARGNVVIENLQVHLEADYVRLNYKTNTGIIENGFVQSGQVVVEGKRIQKTGDQVYVAEDAEFTSCDTCPPGWSFSGNRIEAELGGYAKIRRPVFKIAGWPVLPLPWLLVPLKTDRQSGLLVPSYEYTQRGKLALSESFFWAISRSQDATLTLTYHELLGLKWASEYRYILDEDSAGELRGAYLKDRLFPQELQSTYGVSSNIGRWFVNYSHHYDLPDGFVQRVDVTDISDLEYVRDFPNDLEEWGDPALENRISITKNYDWLHLSSEALIFKNLLREYPLADNSDAVHKMPEIQARTVEIPFWDFGPSINFNLNSTHFVRDRFSYDDLQEVNGEREPIPATGSNNPGEYRRDGSFDPATDLVRTGHRLDMSSRIQAPFQLGSLFQVTPAVTYREMQYQFQVDDSAVNGFPPSAAQRYVQTDILARTEFNRVFGRGGEFGEKYKHAIIPEVGYSNIPWIRRPNHPFFGDFRDQPFARALEPISDQDLNGINKVQFDYDDRVFDRELVTLSLTNQLVKKSFFNGSPSYHNLASFQLSQSYDFNESRTDRPQPWSNITGVLSVDTRYVYADSSTSYNPYARITNTSTRLRIKPEELHYFQISYSKTTLVNQDNEVLEGTTTENIGLGLGMVSKYWDLVANLDYSRVTGELQSWDYITRIKPPGDCWYIELMHRQILGGDVNLKANVSFNFDGI